MAAWWLTACASREAGRPPSSTAPTVAASQSTAPKHEESELAPFSGEIVYRRTAVRKEVPGQSPPLARPLGDQHYFISGPHWKIVDDSGELIALYDPEPNVVHYFGPQRSSVDAGTSEGTASFEHLPETKQVLGRDCKGMRQTSNGSATVVFYDPTLFVDATLYDRHQHGHWDEFLRQTGGGLALWSSMQLPEGSIVSEAIRIEARGFAASFWEVPTAQP